MTTGFNPPAPSVDGDPGGDAPGAVTIIVCNTCRLPGEPEASPRPGALLAAATVEAGRDSGVRVREVGCLGNCRRGLSAAVLRKGSWSYVFGDLVPSSAADLIAGAKLFARSSDDFMPFRARPESLKRGLVARIPTFDNLKETP